MSKEAAETINEDEFWLVNEIAGPVWPDHCGHGLHQFVGSFQYVQRVEDGWHKADLYIFDDLIGRLPGEPVQKVCIRTGEHGEYYSGGSIAEFLMRQHHGNGQMFASACHLLQRKGTVTWNRKEK